MSLLFYPGHSHTQPVVVEDREGEKQSETEKRTPTVFVIGSKWNLAMLANTLTATTKLRQPDGSYKQLGDSYKAHFNAR